MHVAWDKIHPEMKKFSLKILNTTSIKNIDERRCRLNLIITCSLSIVFTQTTASITIQIIFYLCHSIEVDLRVTGENIKCF